MITFILATVLALGPTVDVGPAPAGMNRHNAAPTFERQAPLAAENVRTVNAADYRLHVAPAYEEDNVWHWAPGILQSAVVSILATAPDYRLCPGECVWAYGLEWRLGT